VQLPLSFKLNASISFDNFIYPQEPFLLASIKQFVLGESGPVMFLWGAQSTGKTHLLQAVCQYAATEDFSVSYLPMEELIAYAPEALDGMESFSVICIDDLHLIADRPDWQQAMFNLFNRVADNGGRLLFTANVSPKELLLELKDLGSRLEWGPVFHLQELEDAEKIKVLIARGRQVGLTLGPEVASYLLSRFPRNLSALIEVLDKLDETSLVAQRKITIPFIREVFGDQL